MVAFNEMGSRVSLGQQLDEGGGPVVYPSSAVASPHLFRKVAVSGLCVD